MFTSCLTNNKYHIQINRFALPAIMIMALVVRLIYLSLHPMPLRDGIGYIEFTQSWFDSGEAAIPQNGAINPPLFCYLSRALMFCGFSASTATILVNLSAGVLLLIPVYYAGKCLWGTVNDGLVSACFAAVMPALVKYSCVRLREGLYFLFLFSIICCWIYVLKDRNNFRNSFLCGLFCVCGILCRYESVFLLGFVGFTLVLSKFIIRQWKQGFRVFGFFCAGCFIGWLVVLLLPGFPDVFSIYAHRIYGQCLGTFINPV